jgi:histone H3/H4
MSDKKKNVRKHIQAGLIMPSQRVGKMIRKRFPKRRIQKHVDIAVTACAEYMLRELLKDSADKVDEGKKYMKPEHIHQALNSKTCEVRGMFPSQISGLYKLSE